MERPRKTAALTLAPKPAIEPTDLVEAPAVSETKAPSAAEMKDVHALALKHGPDAIEALAKIVKDGTSEASRIAAANALLDRAYGKARPGAARPEGEGGETKLTVMFV